MKILNVESTGSIAGGVKFVFGVCAHFGGWIISRNCYDDNNEWDSFKVIPPFFATKREAEEAIASLVNDIEGVGEYAGADIVISYSS